jgi:hypothetical protein
VTKETLSPAFEELGVWVLFSAFVPAPPYGKRNKLHIVSKIKKLRQIKRRLN